MIRPDIETLEAVRDAYAQFAAPNQATLAWLDSWIETEKACTDTSYRLRWLHSQDDKDDLANSLGMRNWLLYGDTSDMPYGPTFDRVCRFERDVFGDSLRPGYGHSR
jgi:hypothetical protein